MTTKPKAKKFRVRRPGAAASAQPAPEPVAALEETDDGFGDNDFKKPQAQEAAKVVPRRPAAAASKPAPQNDPTAVEQELAAIRAEGLTGRQLRMARRVAQKHGVDAVSDFDAVRQLRAQGIDPFARSNMLELVAGQDGGSGNLPATVKEAPPPAKPDEGAPVDEESRAREIMKIQRDIARRRRRKMALLSVRLFFFVLIPTLIAGFYYYSIATPLYATKSEFVIQTADGGAGGGASGLGGLFQGTGLATQQDAVGVQSYLISREALARLNEDNGFVMHFSSSEIDALQRLEADSSNEAAYRLYKRMVKIGYDPTEGLIKMEVIAADPQTSQAFSESLIRYAEEQVDQQTARLRGDQLKGARESLNEAERRLQEANNRVIDLQEQRGVVSADVELSGRMAQIGQIETQLREERLRLERLLQNASPNRTRVQVLESNIAQLDAELNALRAGLTEGGANQASLARISAELGVAQIELQTRTALLQQAAQQFETARIEADRQVRYLSNSVPPRAPDEPTYPRAFENTLLAFLVFAGIYLMISLTSSILREQVSA